MTARPSRLISLDLLRAVAIILTVLHHCMGHLDFGPYAPPRSGLFLGITHAGWIGVPMFFVLSGFLICHLLMREYIESGRVRLGRFLVRRGLKIYPPFYLCIIVYGAYLYFSPRGLAGEEVWRELFFLQNYGMKGFLGIDWSLAVEEHFYLIFGLLAAWLGRPRAYGARDLARWRCVPWLAAALVVACLMLRIYNTPINWSATHNRIDALFVGAAMGWFYNVHRERFIRVFRPLPWLAAVVFVLAAVPAAMPDAVAGVWFIDTWYLVILTLAMVPLLGASLVVEAVPDRWLWRASAFVGRHSYCIYLFHVLFLKLSSKAWSVLHWYPPFWLAIVWGLAGSIAVGVAITRLVEVPVLRFRDLVSPRPVKHFLSPASASAVGGTHDTVPVTEGATPGLEMQNG